MNILQDQMTSSAQVRVTREVEKDGTIVWTSRDAKGRIVERKRLITDENGKIIAAMSP